MKTKYYLRIMVLVASFLLVFSLISGCGKRPNVSNPTQSAIGGEMSDESSEPGNTNDTNDSPDPSGAGGTGNPSGKNTTASASKTSKNNNNGTTKPAKVDDNPFKRGWNLKGATITIVCENDDYFSRKKSTSSYNNAIVERTAKLEKQLNCKINMIIRDASSVGPELFMAQMSGDKYADIIFTQIFRSISFISALSVVDLNTVPNLDLSKPYTNFGAIQQSAGVKDKVYAIATEEMLGSGAYGVYYNKRILRETPSIKEDPYTLAKNNQWTISKFREMMSKGKKKLTGGSRWTIEDQWGAVFADYGAGAGEAFLGAYNAELLSRVDGVPKVTTNSKAVHDAMQTINEIYHKDGFVPPIADADTPTKYNMFMNGKALFLASIPYDLSTMDDDYGFVPFPRADSVQTGRTFASWGQYVIVVPKAKNPSDLENVGKFLTAFCWESHYYTTAAKHDYICNKYFRDEQSAEMYKLAVSRTKTSPQSFFASVNNEGVHDGTYRTMYNIINNKGTVNDFAKKFDVASNYLKELVDKLIAG